MKNVCQWWNADAYETSLSKLDAHEWAILRNQWAKGSDWNIAKLGRLWRIMGEHFETWPPYKTKRAASEAHDVIICAEARWRAYQRLIREENEA